jgi:hypothetical protein
MGTSGLVSHWLGGRTNDCAQWVVGGIFRELSEGAEKKGIALLPKPEPDKGYSPHGWNSPNGGSLTSGVPFDPFLMATFLEEKLLAAGVQLLYMTRVVDVAVEGGRIVHAVLHNKSGFSAVRAAAFIDATGDADIAALSGCRTILGREEDRLMTPVTLQVHMDHIDSKALAAYINTHDATRFLKEIEELTAKGEWPFSYNRFISVRMLDDDVFMVNTTRITGIDGTDGASVTKGMIQGRKEIEQLLGIMRKHIPGCAEARIRAVASLLGVRETRRIQAGFSLSVADAAGGTDFSDAVGHSSYPWDLPDPLKPSYQPLHDKPLAMRRPTVPIPFRIMLPEPVKNLICPGRAVSVERHVLGPLRVMAPCMAMGQAAGTAAVLSLASAAKGSSVDFSALDAEALRRSLRQAGCFVDYDPSWERK